MDFLRPKDRVLDLGIQKNWGDWYLHTNATTTMVNGYRVIPPIFPKHVPNRLIYKEIIWQVKESNKAHLRGHKKGFLLPPSYFFYYTNKQGWIGLNLSNFVIL